jgi:predicted transcriptional regulator
MNTLPSGGELEILRVLWRIGPATVGQVHDELPRGGEIGYNTVGKLLHIMEGKSLVARDDSARAHVFRPLVAKDSTQRGLVRDLAERAFSGSAAALALRALSDEALTDDEIRELRTLLMRLDG